MSDTEQNMVWACLATLEREGRKPSDQEVAVIQYWVNRMSRGIQYHLV